MALEPFEGSEWGERGAAQKRPKRQARKSAEAPSAPPAPRAATMRPGRTPRTRGGARNGLLGTALVVAGAAMVAFALATALGLFAPDASKLEPADASALVGPLGEIHDAQQEQIREAMNSPFVLGVSRKRLDRIAECESHGDPRAKSSDGLYRGKYQFDRHTWKAMGGEGDPAKASELEQDRRAAALLKVAGSNPWPVCG